MVSTFITAAQMLVANTSIGVSARSFTLIRVASTFILVTQLGIPATHPGIRITLHGGGVSHTALGCGWRMPKRSWRRMQSSIAAGALQNPAFKIAFAFTLLIWTVGGLAIALAIFA